MMYKLNSDKKLPYNSYLIKYITENYGYNDETLVYSNKYTGGTFSITTPKTTFCNCKYINGYPHFNINKEIALEEINNFINEIPIYDNNFIIRFGDTHPHKPVPKLAQIRNIYINDIMNSMITTKKTKKSIYTIGDISVKSIQDFLIKNNIDNFNECSEKIFKALVNNTFDENCFFQKYCCYKEDSLFQIQEFFNKIGINCQQFLFESELYKNNNLYNKIKSFDYFKDELKQNGELKYSLQELMFIFNMIENDDFLINIIGCNQEEHIRKVLSLINKYDNNLNLNFLAYGFCKNGESRDIEEWSRKIDSFIETNKIVINNEYISFSFFLKILFISLNNNNIINFNDLEKYKGDINKFKLIYDSFLNNEKMFNNDDYRVDNDLINMMSLVNYYLDKSIQSGDHSLFFKYIYNIVKEFNKKKDIYKNMQYLYYNFLYVALKRMSIFNEYQKKENLERRLIL